MKTIYAHHLVKAILQIFRCRMDNRLKRGLLIVMVCPFMSARSLLDAAETSGMNKNILYEAVDQMHDLTVISNLRRVGIARLVQHLRRLKTADSSVRSRGCVTLCADDFTRQVRGQMGGLAHPAYSGAEGKVVYGLRVEALIAVIGEDESIVLDSRVIPPKNSVGRPRASHSEWMMDAIFRLAKEVESRGVSLKGCYLSVDSAYAAGWFVDDAEWLGLKVVSELRSKVTVWSWFWIPIPAGVYFALFRLGHRADFTPLTRDPEVLHLRHRLETRIYGSITVVVFLLGPDLKLLFTRDPMMKSWTVRRIAKRRWQLERVFWNLKQLLGMTAIHQQTRNRVLVRVYLAFLVAQASQDAASRLKITVNHLHKILRRDHSALYSEIRSATGSVPGAEADSAATAACAA